ncbi:hypothetical protein N9J72_00875 [Candidatus Gracilibacteria bacterium]|nr:hypothetical protein [Candidatus Gracilibacteria bacterium]
MTHILDTVHEELERTHRLVETYRPQHLKSMFFSFFPQSFRKVFAEYAEIKEHVILNYQELHNNIDSKKLDVQSIQTVQNELVTIGAGIERSLGLLSHLVTRSDIQENILIHEKKFFLLLLKSFQSDIVTWVGNHETQVFGNVSSTSIKSDQNNIAHTVQILEERKQKLEAYIKNKS